VYAILKPFI